MSETANTRRGMKMAAMAGTAVTATALTMSVATPPQSIARQQAEVALAADAQNLPVITTGALFGLASALGLIPDSIPAADTGLGVGADLTWTAANASGIYNAVN